jgi:hypothetical protein
VLRGNACVSHIIGAMAGVARIDRAFAAVACVVVACALAACGGSSPAKSSASAGTPAGSSQYDVAVRYAHCMRANGVPSFPDPHNPGGFEESAIDALPVRSPAYIAGAKVCAHLLPNGGLPTAGENEQRLLNGVAVAKCMRKHGVNMPDPSQQANGQLEMNLANVNTNAPDFNKVGDLCEKKVFGYS